MNVEDLESEYFIFTYCQSCQSKHPIVEIEFEDETSNIMCLNCGIILDEDVEIFNISNEELEKFGYTEDLIFYMIQERRDEILSIIEKESISETDIDDIQLEEYDLYL